MDRFQLSVTQRKTLKLLGKAKQQGELQSVLANKLKIGPGSCSSVLKNLEERGLITRCPTVLHRGGGVVINTNFVLLTKFAPKDIIHPGARISDNRSSTMTQGVPLPGAAPTMANYDFANNGDSGGDGSGDDHMDMDMDDDGDEDENMMTRGVGDPSPTSAAAAAGTLHVVNDDEVYLRAITSRLASAPDQTMRESLLKQALGYTGTPKQRQWSRFRSILEKKKCVKTHLASMDGGCRGQIGQPFTVIKLLNEWVGEQDEECPLMALLDPVTMKLNVFGEQIPELTIDRQILRLLAVAGSAGVTTHQFESQLHISLHRNKNRFKELLRRCGPNGVVEQMVNEGKVRMKRYTASPELLVRLNAAFQGDGSGGEEDVHMQEQHNPPAPVPLAIVSATAATPRSAAAAVEAEAVPGTDATTTTITTTITRPLPPPTETETEKSKKKKSRLVTELASLRRQWLVDKVNQDGLLLKSEMGAYLQSKERNERKNPDAVRTDKKVNQRIIDAAIEAGEVVEIHVGLPDIRGSLSARPVTVIAKPGTVKDAAFIHRAMAEDKEMLPRIRFARLNGSVTTYEDPNGTHLPLLVPTARQRDPAGIEEGGGGGSEGGKGGGGAPGLIARESRKKTRRLAIDNGFIASPIQRARKLHEAVWSVIEARNGAHSPFVSAQMTDAANEGKAFLLENGLARENRSGQYEDTTEQQSLLITADELWKGLTIDDFVSTLGSHCADRNLVAGYQKASKKLGE